MVNFILFLIKLLERFDDYLNKSGTYFIQWSLRLQHAIFRDMSFYHKLLYVDIIKCLNNRQNKNRQGYSNINLLNIFM